MQQGTPEWLEWRKQGIGASEIAAILGLSPYMTPYEVWLDKTGRGRAFVGNFATQRGNELEAEARARYELVAMEDMPPALAVHPKYEIIRVSLDGLRADGKKVLEIKCPGKEAHEKALAGLVPEYYVPQTQLQLAATGADDLDYFSYYQGSHALVPVLPDIAYQGMLIAKALQFWNDHVKADIAPSLTERDVLISDHPKVLELAGEIVLKGDKLAKKQLDAMKAEIIQLGGHTKIRCGRVLVSKSKTATGKDSFRLTIGKEEVNV